MFPVRALLQHADCPDYDAHGKCDRVACPFGHTARGARSRDNGKSCKRRASEVTSDESDDDDISSGPKGKKVASNDPRNSTPVSELSRTNPSQSSQASQVRPDQGGGSSSSGGSTAVQARHAPRNAYAARVSAGAKEGGSAAAERTARAALASSSSASTQRLAAPTPPRQDQSPARAGTGSSTGASASLSAPLIARHLHPAASKVPYAVRQSSLRTYFTTFVSLYAPLIPPPSNGKDTAASSSRKERAHALLKRVTHQIACEDALACESKIFKTSNTNPTTYRNSVRTDLVSLARRKKRDEADQMEALRCIGRLGIDMFRLAFSLSEQEQEDGEDAAAEEVVGCLRKSNLIGTPEEASRKTALLAEQANGMMDIKRLESAGLLATAEQLSLSHFPMPPRTDDVAANDKEANVWAGVQPLDVQDRILEHWGLGGTQPDMVGQDVVCDRCSVPYVVREIDLAGQEAEECRYHWGKCRVVKQAGRVRGPRERRWTCCEALDESSSTGTSTSLSDVAKNNGFPQATGTGLRIGVPGCTRGPHVFKEEQDMMLHRRVKFVSTDNLLTQCKAKNESTTHQVLALDCELVHTTAGLSLARLTVLDERGVKVLDCHVRPHAAVIDYNTRFSGIRAEDVANARCSLQDARLAMGKLMTAQTILVGHGLENDLRAIRLLHTRIVDSALLFPHARGLPFRMSLRDLTRIHLGRYIQRDDEVAGHDPEEDAQAALDLVRLKYREESEHISQRPASSSSTHAVGLTVAKATAQGLPSKSQPSPLSVSPSVVRPPPTTVKPEAPSMFLPPVRRK